MSNIIVFLINHLQRVCVMLKFVQQSRWHEGKHYIDCISASDKYYLTRSLNAQAKKKLHLACDKCYTSCGF